MCGVFKESRGYDKFPISQSERDFPLAFVILVNNEVDQFERLLRVLYRSHNIYCIHIDAKSSQETFDALKSIVDCFDNVFLTTKREPVVWGGITLLNADLNCMRDLLNLQRLVAQKSHPNLIGKKFVNWKYVLNSASTMFPLRTNFEMTKILRMYNGSNEMEIIKGGVNSDRYETSYLIDPATYEVVNTGVRKIPPPYNFTIIKCSNYCVISKSFTDYIINSKYGRDLLAWFNDTYVADEMQVFSALFY